ncbi:MAG: HAMP domain-containing histidine kinase [Gammaproteobacteria bacterium]|nr:MAG: HAMP domain-containing histidine kinase [Gammaproteobacteria bacterium]UCH39213.1 MAG: HAMP domain-containing histidine kinase [Gammaproteobacteria bacterium]
MLAYLQRKWQSLIFRLLFYFLIAILALAIVLGVSFAKRVRPHVQNEILPNVERYIEYLIDDIGIPPDLVVAQRLADELPFELRIEGQGVDWSSSPRLGAISGYHFEPAPAPYDNVYFSHHRRAEYLLVELRDYRYLFVVDNSFRLGQERRHGFLFVFLGLIFFVLYFAIRRLFRPLETMSQQVRGIGEGDLEQTVDVPGKNELALLAAGINRMSAQIKSMLEGKSALLLAISHELRSPMTRMRVNLELLDESDIRKKLIEDLHEMENLVAAILESERLNRRHAPLNLSRCALGDLVEGVIRDHPCRQRIETRLSPVELDIDPMRIRLLVKNLVDNACQYSQAADGPIDVVLNHGQHEVTLEFHDRGVGIEAQEIPRLTEAFYRPDSARQRDTGGYGLGLYLCRLIAEAHGGNIDIESLPGRGTKVAVRLPLDNS